MNAKPIAEVDNAHRREDMLRELNLYPMWQLRNAAATNAPAEVVQILPADTTEQIHVEQVLVGETFAKETIGGETTHAGTENLTWTELKNRVHACTACKLRAGCRQTVFGSGDLNADWLFVGSWPTEDDESAGTPFAGQAGQLLDNMLAAIKLKRDANVYLANVVKCSGSIQRGPQADEIAQCASYLARQIQLIQPKIIVALGHAAASALLGEDREWHSLVGKIHEFRGYANDSLSQSIPLVITHHPAALLLAPLGKAQAWRDLCLARDTIKESE